MIIVDGDGASRRVGVLEAWRQVGRLVHGARRAAIGDAFADLLLLPEIDPVKDDGRAFVAAHAQLLQAFAQRTFATLRSADALVDASARMLAAALHVAASLNADRGVLIRWPAP